MTSQWASRNGIENVCLSWLGSPMSGHPVITGTSEDIHWPLVLSTVRAVCWTCGLGGTHEDWSSHISKACCHLPWAVQPACLPVFLPKPVKQKITISVRLIYSLITVHTLILQTHSICAGYTPALVKPTALNISTFILSFWPQLLTEQGEMSSSILRGRENEISVGGKTWACKKYTFL